MLQLQIIINYLLSISLVICWVVIIMIQQKNQKLKQEVDLNKEAITKLFKITNERLLHSKTD